LASLGLLYLCFDFRLIELVFIGIIGYVIQHLAEKVAVVGLLMISFLIYTFGEISTEAAMYLYYVLSPILTIATCMICYFAIAKRFNRVYLNKIHHWHIILFSVTVILVVYVLSSAISLLSLEGFLAPILVHSAFILFSILFLVLLISLFFNVKLMTEGEQVEQILAMERRQHEISRSNIALINRKCHDLKHQINYLRQIESKEERDQSIAKMEKAISIYESMMKTGNDSLDVILTEKSLVCETHGIRLACILDGKQISFMKASDICSLFGNILDNAIEAVNKVADQEKRLITLNLFEQKNMIFLQEENYFEGKLTWKDGLPLTTSEDNGFHGFGMSSIRYITQSYHGTMVLDINDNMFSLNIVFPAKQLP
ncbi:MAG: GHKL domain-containing protein, partial [Clostridia bacterium]|nr:GHKL domain-containing protein [Clostridia bacterium]